MRRLKDWLTSYEEYARDAFCPAAFHKWVGLSVLAGALERKVWTLNSQVHYYPNLFVILVTYPGAGKSTALNRGTNLLERLRLEYDPSFKIIPHKSTDAAFVKAMGIRQEITVGTKIVYHSSGYFYASEASASALQNTHGDFIASITDFYDCPRVAREVTISRGENEMHNVCFNMLSGATFEYLRNLVNETSVMGGFASRVIYVVSKERIIRTPKWGIESIGDTDKEQLLYEDLCEIHDLKGRFTPTPKFISAWEKFQPESDRALAEMNSPRLESLAARRPLNIMKVAMLLSVSESSELILDVRHWDEARKLIDEVSKDNAFILSQGAIADKNSQTGVTQLIGQTLKKHGGRMSYNQLKRLTLANGNQVDSISKTFEFMVNTGWLRTDGDSVELLVDPDRYL